MERKKRENKVVVPQTAKELHDPQSIHAYYQKIINCMPNNVYWLDRNCVTQGCNQNVLNLVGLKSLNEFVGITYEQMGDLAGWTEGQAQSFKKDDLEVMATGIAKFNVEEPPLYDKNGNPVYYMSSRVPIFDDNNQVIGIVGISVDITERIKMEENLRVAKENAEAASRAKTMFLANMSHDIKTPIAGIISTAEYLMHSIKEANFQDRANDIVQSGLRLLELMIEIIEVSRLEVKETTHSQIRFKLKKLVDDIIQLIKPATAEKDFKLILNYDEKIPNYLIGDRWHLYRVILNLLSNAIKFTEHGSITIDLTLSKQSTNLATIEICVSDSGIGIPKDKQAVIFDEFTRLTPSYEGIYKGTGLGLYIVKQFVEAMHGEVHVESEEGKGSIFTCIIPFKIPVIQEDTDIDIASEQSLISKVGKKISIEKTQPEITTHPKIDLQILLVEDNLIAAKTAKATLEMLGASVKHAENGTNAINLFEKNKFDLIFMDLGLPDMSGTEATIKIREIENATNTLKIPIIAVSAHIDEKIKKSCFDIGITDAVTKPLIIDQAKTILDKILSIKQNGDKEKQEIPTIKLKIEEKLKVIDLELGASILGTDDIAKAKQLLRMLIDTLPANVVEMDVAYKNKEYKKLEKIAHSAHGGVAYVGAPRLKKALHTIVAEIRANHLDDIDCLYKNVCDEINELIAEYKKL